MTIPDITITQVFDFVGTVAFAISGIRLASANRFDLFGAYVVGVTTAIGGGTMRDLMLGLTPFWLTNPFYLICSAFALLWVIAFRKLLVRQNNTWFLFDTIGLALFTVVGVEKTISSTPVTGGHYPFWAAIIMGAITGAGGGVLRDVFINEEPLIFRKEIYALACVIGGLAYYICYVILNMTQVPCAIICGVTVVVMRLLAVKYKLSLPIINGEE